MLRNNKYRIKQHYPPVLRAINAALIQAQGGSSPSVTYVNQDNFTTQRAAGAVNATNAEPGPGKRTVVDTNSLITINAGAQLQFGPGTPAADDRFYFPETVVTRAPGLCCRMDWVSGTIAGADRMGFLSTLGVGVAAISGANYSDTDSNNVGIVFAAGTTAFIVLRTLGAFYIVKSGTTYTLYWEDFNGNGNAVAGVRCAAVNHLTLKMDNFQIVQLDAPWKTDFDICTTYLTGARAAGNTFTHEGDFMVDVMVTTLNSAGTMQLAFRIQDDNNYWRIDIASDGSMSLQEVVDGTPTQRASAGANSVSTGHRLTFRAVGGSIAVTRDGLTKMSYASATNFATATGGKIISLGTGGALTGLAAYPRTLSGAAKAALDAV